MRAKLLASEMSRAMTCESPWIKASSSARTPSRMTYTLVAVAVARTAPATNVSTGPSPAWARRSQARASPAEQAYTIVSHRAVSHASTHASERPSASSR